MDLHHIREKIDTIDTKIIHLLNERMDWAVCSTPHKQQLEDPAREQSLVNRIIEHYGQAIPARTVQAIFHEVLKLSKHLQQESLGHLFFLGGHGGSTSELCQKIQQQRRLIAIKKLEELIKMIKATPKSQGLLCLDNLSTKNLNHLWLNLKQKRITVNSVLLAPPAATVIMAEAGVDHRTLRHIWTTPSTFITCSHWFDKYQLQAKLFTCESHAARCLLDSSAPNTAIAGSLACAEWYGFEILSQISPTTLNGSMRVYLLLDAQPSCEHNTSALFQWEKGTSHQPRPSDQSTIWYRPYPIIHHIHSLSGHAATESDQLIQFYADIKEIKS